MTAGYLSLSGGTLTGFLTLSGLPTAANHAATKAYADTFLPSSGGALSGNLTVKDTVYFASTGMSLICWADLVHLDDGQQQL